MHSNVNFNMSKEDVIEYNEDARRQALYDIVEYLMEDNMAVRNLGGEEYNGTLPGEPTDDSRKAFTNGTEAPGAGAIDEGSSDPLTQTKNILIDEVLIETEKNAIYEEWADNYKTRPTEQDSTNFHDYLNNSYKEGDNGWNMPVLDTIYDASKKAAELLVGSNPTDAGSKMSSEDFTKQIYFTGLHESMGGRAKNQVGGGPGSGYFSVEVSDEHNTAADIMRGGGGNNENSFKYMSISVLGRLSEILQDVMGGEYELKRTVVKNPAGGEYMEIRNDDAFLTNEELRALVQHPEGGAIMAGLKYLGYGYGNTKRGVSQLISGAPTANPA